MADDPQKQSFEFTADDESSVVASAQFLLASIGPFPAGLAAAVGAGNSLYFEFLQHGQTAYGPVRRYVDWVGVVNVEIPYASLTDGNIIEFVRPLGPAKSMKMRCGTFGAAGQDITATIPCRVVRMRTL